MKHKTVQYIKSITAAMNSIHMKADGCVCLFDCLYLKTTFSALLFRSFSNVDEAQHEEPIGDEGEAPLSELHETISFEQNSPEPPQSPSPSTSKCPKIIPPKQVSTSQRGATNTKTNDRGKILASFEKRSAERHDLIKNLLSSEEELDDIDLCFQSLAKSVKKLTPQRQITAKLECMKTICKLQEEEMHSSSPLPNFGYHYSANTTPSPSVSIENNTQWTSATAPYSYSEQGNFNPQQLQPASGESKSSAPFTYSASTTPSPFFPIENNTQ